MMKNNKWKLLISSIIILLPIVFGLIFWNELPETLITHWGADGNADGWSSRPVAILALPIFLLLIHWFCVFVTAKDPRNKGQNHKVFDLVLWICPVISLFAAGVTYTAAFGKDLSVVLYPLSLIGLLFVVIGNYLPKCKQNDTIGIKIKWTLQNEENWNATHRFAGKIWVAGGLLMMVSAFLPENVFLWVLISSMILMTVVPLVYSYLYYKKRLKEGKADITPIAKIAAPKSVKIVSAVFLMAILIFVGFLMFTGDITVEYADSSFTVNASFWHKLIVEYSAVDSVEYREYDDAGVRTGGLGSARLLVGAFRNDEFGNYTRYSYTKCDACVILDVDGKILVINGSDADSTKAIYEKIKSNIG